MSGEVGQRIETAVPAFQSGLKDMAAATSRIRIETDSNCRNATHGYGGDFDSRLHPGRTKTELYKKRWWSQSTYSITQRPDERYHWSPVVVFLAPSSCHNLY